MAARSKFPWWKLLGLAGVVGVTATGVALARNERERRSYTADEVRDRLHERLRDARRNDGVLVLEPQRSPGFVSRQFHRFWTWCVGSTDRTPTRWDDPEGELHPSD